MQLEDERGLDFVVARVTFTGPHISDVFSSGVLLLYALCGPWRAENLFSLFPLLLALSSPLPQKGLLPGPPLAADC